MPPGSPGAPPLKPLVWVGGSKEDLGRLPREIVKAFGYALYLAQTGGRHENCRIMTGKGHGGVIEIIEYHQGNAYRAVYTTHYPKAIFVLHVFQKKSKTGRATPRRDLQLIARRLKVAATAAGEIEP